MPIQQTVVQAFVSSPDDVREERDCLEDVVRELNSTWSKSLGIRLELIRWETDGYPGFGSDAQDVLNRELPDDYDIFLGIMWTRFGTPTGRAGSGTEEEFNRAYRRYKEGEHDLKILFYFKNAPIEPDKVDAAQLASVRRFRDGLGEMGSLYWIFNNRNEFEQLASAVSI
ncbi:MAG: DUF4062 domain-containing protein [bacterium]|nr:DUF4062 domain-containing protein [bacterium]